MKAGFFICATLGITLRRIILLSAAILSITIFIACSGSTAESYDRNSDTILDAFQRLFRGLNAATEAASLGTLSTTDTTVISGLRSMAVATSLDANLLLDRWRSLEPPDSRVTHYDLWTQILTEAAEGLTSLIQSFDDLDFQSEAPDFSTIGEIELQPSGAAP